MPDDLAKQLEQITLFAKLSRDDRKAVARLVKPAQYPAGSEVCRQGQLGETAYIVESGELRVLHVDPQGVEREVARLGPGEYFGETSLLLGEPRDATVEVVRDATLLVLNKDELDQLLQERPWMLKSLQMRPDVARKRRARRFKWQAADEVVIVSQHRHNVILLRGLLIPGFVLLVDLLICGYLYAQSRAALVLVVGIIVGLLPLVFALYLAADHYDDVYIVTNKRVVRREHAPFGREERAEAPLRNIQDIQDSQAGLAAQLFNFGDLIIETAGERGHVAFREIPRPSEVKEIIFEQIRRIQAGARAEERAAIRDALLRRLVPAEGQVPTPAPPPQEQRLKAMPTWFRVLLSLFTHFLPPQRHVQGDTITWRKHWITLVVPIGPPTLLITVVTLVTVYILRQNPPDWTSVLLGYGVAMVFLAPWWLWQFDDWQNDIYQVTATRIIDVERLPFHLREERREASLAMIQNIRFEIPGTLGKLLNYGSVTIETAGAGAFTFDYVRDPRSVQSEIFRRMEAFQRRQSQMAADRHRNELLDWFAVYDQVRRSTPSATQPASSPQQET